MQNSQIKMFGCTIEDLEVMLDDSICNPEMLAMSILSDAQEAMAFGDTKTTRQFINRAKWILSKQLLKAA
jgi:hypothetical protein